MFSASWMAKSRLGVLGSGDKPLSGDNDELLDARHLHDHALAISLAGAHDHGALKDLVPAEGGEQVAGGRQVHIANAKAHLGARILRVLVGAGLRKNRHGLLFSIEHAKSETSRPLP